MKKILFLIIIIFISCINISITQVYSSPLALDDVVGSWVSPKDFVSISVDENEMAVGPFSHHFSSVNVTGWMNIDFVTVEPQNFSGKLLTMWIKIQNNTLHPSLSFTLYDIAGNSRGFWDITHKFALEPNIWAKIVNEVDYFQWEDSNFDPTQIAKIRFIAYNEGEYYSQNIWIEKLTLLSEEDGSTSYSDNFGNAFDYSLVLNVLFLFFICYCAGFTLFHLCNLNFPSWNFVMSFPLYVVTGVVSLVVLFSLFCLVYFDVIVSWLIFSGVFIAFLITIKKNWANLKIRIITLKKTNCMLFVLLFTSSIIIFLRLALDIGWGAYVDSQTHGLFTSLILFHKGFPSSSYPVGDLNLSPVRYPMGFHAFSAFNSFLSSAYPGKGILIVATVLVSLLPMLFFSIVRAYTNSTKLSFIAFLLLFLLPGFTPELWRPSHDFLLGNYLIGNYPNLLGNVIMMALLTHIVVSSSTKFSMKQSLLIYTFLAVCLFFSYYPFLPFFAFFILLKLCTIYFERPKLNWKSGALLFALLSSFLILLYSILFCKESFVGFFSLDTSLLHTIYMRYPLFELDSPYLVYTLFILVAFPFSLWFLSKKKLKEVGLLFLSIFIPLMVAQNKQMYTTFTWFIQPDRVLILLVISSYLIVLLGIAEFSKINYVRNKCKSFYIRYSKCPLNLSWLAVVCIFLLITPSLASYITYSYPAQYKSSLPNSNDYKALEWLAENATSELILNDRTVMGLWASSFKALKLINDREIVLKVYLFGTLNGTLLANRTNETNKILDFPCNYRLIEELMQQYNISYIYISESDQPLYERGQVISPFPWSNLSQKERILIYQLNSNIEVVFRSGNAVIFKLNN